MLDPQGRPHGTPLDDVLHLWSLPFGALPLSSRSSCPICHPLQCHFCFGSYEGLGGICGKYCSMPDSSKFLVPFAPASLGAHCLSSSRLICLPTQCQLLWQREVVLYIGAIMHPHTSRGYYLTLGFGGSCRCLYQVLHCLQTSAKSLMPLALIWQLP